MVNVIKYQDILIDSISYKKIVSYKKKNLLPTFYNNNNKLLVAINSQRIYNIEISDKIIIIDFEIDNDFRNFLIDLNQKNMEYIKNNSKKWIRKDQNFSIENNYTNNLILKKNTSKTILQFKILIDQLTCDIPLQVFDKNKNKISIFEINKNDNVQLLLEYNGLLFDKDFKFEPLFNILQLRITKKIQDFEKVNKFNSCLLNDKKKNIYDSDDEDVKIKNEYFQYL